MVVRLAFENNDDIGVFSHLTNNYCVVSTSGCENFYSTIHDELSSTMPVFNTTIGGTKLVGRLVTGNRSGLLVPNLTTDVELQHIRNCLPDNVRVKRIPDPRTALGNCICTNDYVTLIHPDMDPETEEIIADVLNTETFRTNIGGEPLVGSHCRLTNSGAIVNPHTTRQQMTELAQLLGIPVAGCTVNGGTPAVASGLIANDYIAFAGRKTTTIEMVTISKILNLDADQVSQAGQMAVALDI